MAPWDAIRWLHLLAMAFFVGGQLFLVTCVVPVVRGDRPRIQAVARRFGWGTLGAFAAVLVLWHMQSPGDHWLEGLIFVVSLAIVWLGVALAHG